MCILNIVFHKVYESINQFDDKYSVDFSYVNSFTKLLSKYINAQRKINGVRIYFDDNYKLPDKIIKILEKSRYKKVIAVPIESVSKSDRYSYYELVSLKNMGFDIVPHGFSHSALAVYINDELEPTPRGGIYQNTPIGKNKILSEQEVLFQLIESKNAFKKCMPKEFVLPYGLYNRDTVKLNLTFSIYSFLATCDMFLDLGEHLRPRFLITNDLSPEKNIDLIKSLTPREYDKYCN